MGAIMQVTDETFESEVSTSNIPVLVDFWADWCAPCKAMLPALEDVAEAMKGEIKILKLNIVENEKTAARMGARSIPLLVLFSGGVEKARHMGALSRTRLSAFIEGNL